VTAEVLLEYDRLLFGDDGRTYRARAWGGEAHDGTHRWHGWIEFLPLEGGSPVRTARETTQPDRTCTVYWSTGLTRVYLEGALERALRLADAIRTNSLIELTSFDRWFLKSLVIAPG
jgi:hypothetical protein